MRLRMQVLLLQLAVIAVSLAVGFGLVLSGADDRVRDEYAQRALAIAQSVAADSTIIDEVAVCQGAVLDPAQLAAGPLQSEANAVRQRTGALFVVIGNASGIRLAHPDDDQLAQHVSTDPSNALAGNEEVTTDRGTLGESVRAKVPIVDDGRVVGFISVGVSTERLAAETRRDIAATAIIALVALGVGALGSILLARRWRRLTLGLEPDELTELVREQGAVLHSISDGVLAVDSTGVVRVANDTARRLLDLPDPVGTEVDELSLSPRVRGVLDQPTPDPVAATIGDRVVLVSSHTVEADGRDLGMVLSVVDRTDVEHLTREVDSIRAMSTVLRAHRHETANRMHVLAGLLRHGHTAEAIDYLDEVNGVGGRGARLAGLDNVGEPHLEAFLDAKAAHARERATTLTLGDQTWVQGSLRDPVVVTTVLGNLVDNAIDASARPETAGPGGDGHGTVEVEVITDGHDLIISVADSGPGISFDDPAEIFAEGVTTKADAAVPGGRGMGLALSRQIARRIGGDIWVADPGGDDGGAVLVARLPAVLETAQTADQDGEGDR
ncbi:sensor histidine kinase [Gordonia sp. Z-3]|uniref:sensor histidine kinase n=1 Tax=Gordonia sp. Z-3 TaxID=3115408 RepID=UPI002E2909A3|nr:sensor histidine kinase [Gordonia sp. Z-3]MED5803420.1 sensor histidine kinase [Gordonia sp. Z-3]